MRLARFFLAAALALLPQSTIAQTGGGSGGGVGGAGTTGECAQWSDTHILTTSGAACGVVAGTVTTTGSPANGNLSKFSGASTITNGDLSGVVTTSGTLATSLQSSVALPGSPTTTTQSAGDNSTKVSTTAFVTTAVANAIAGVNPAVAVQAATTSAANTSSYTYNNGVSGIGATLTGVANTALTVDGYTFTAVGQRLLVKNDTQSPSGAFNGVYYVTQVQTGVLPVILTRALDYDMPSDMNNTGAIPVVNGTVNGTTSFVQTSQVTTVGTDPVTFTNFSLSPTTLVVGPASATDGHLAVFDGASGKLIKDGGTPAPVAIPQGRLTLVTATPVMTSDQTAKSQVYYDCYAGKQVPYYDGTTDQADTIASCEVSLTMQTSGTGVTNSAGVFDVWWVHSGANRICVATNGSGGGWASDTSGSNTARGTGYSQVHNTRGYWTNVNSIASCYNGSTNYGSVSADQATYLGTLYTTAAGQTGMSFLPAAASGGSNPFLALYNGYNRVKVASRSRDSTSSWSYSTATWRASDNNTNSRVSFVDGLGQSTIFGYRQILMQGVSAAPVIGMDLDSTSATPLQSYTYAFDANAHDESGHVADSWAPVTGLHFIQAMEYCAGSTCQYSGNTSVATRPDESLQVQLDM